MQVPLQYTTALMLILYLDIAKYVYMYIYLISHYILVHGTMRHPHIWLIAFLKLVKINILMNTNFMLNLFENYRRAQKLLGKERKGGKKQIWIKNCTGFLFVYLWKSF